MTDAPVKIVAMDSTGMLDSGGVVVNVEKALVASSWYGHILNNSPQYKVFDKGALNRVYNTKILYLLEKRPGMFSVAFNSEDEEQMVGWVCKERDILHFAYVKQAFRGYGIGRKLVGDCTVASNWTDTPSLLKSMEYKPEKFARLF